MIKVSVLYPAGEAAKFDMDYYCKRHMPMVQEKLGAAFQAAFAPHAATIMGDIPNYTNVQPVIQISEAKM